jgi:AcrR family transcriptional regulator
LSSTVAPTDPPREASPSRSSAPTRILEAAEALLLEDGADGVSIRKLSERCGYSAPTIYHHFGDKQGLINSLLEKHFRVLLERMMAIPQRDEPAQHLREMARAFVSFAIENPAHYQLLTVPREGDPVPSATAARDLVREDLELLRRGGSLATDDIDAAFDVVWAMLHGVIMLHLGPRTPEIAADLRELAFDVVEAGLLKKGNASR